MSVGHFHWPDLSKDVARTRIVRMGATTEMPLDTPDRVQRGLYRTLYPRWGPRDVVTREENATLVGGQVVLHEVRVHPAVISVVSRQRTLERAERVFIGLPGDGDRVADDVAGDVDVGIDLLERRKCEPNPMLDRMRQHLQGVAHPRVGKADHARLVIAVVEEVRPAG